MRRNGHIFRLFRLARMVAALMWDKREKCKAIVSWSMQV